MKKFAYLVVTAITLLLLTSSGPASAQAKATPQEEGLIAEICGVARLPESGKTSPTPQRLISLPDGNHLSIRNLPDKTVIIDCVEAGYRYVFDLTRNRMQCQVVAERRTIDVETDDLTYLRQNLMVSHMLLAPPKPTKRHWYVVEIETRLGRQLIPPEARLALANLPPTLRYFINRPSDFILGRALRLARY